LLLSKTKIFHKAFFSCLRTDDKASRNYTHDETLVTDWLSACGENNFLFCYFLAFLPQPIQHALVLEMILFSFSLTLSDRLLYYLAMLMCTFSRIYIQMRPTTLVFKSALFAQKKIIFIDTLFFLARIKFQRALNRHK
jgi:hypothetical protein